MLRGLLIAVAVAVPLVTVLTLGLALLGLAHTWVYIAEGIILGLALSSWVLWPQAFRSASPRRRHGRRRRLTAGGDPVGAVASSTVTPRPIPCSVRLDDVWAPRTETRVASGGAWTVALTTELPDSKVRLHSAYTGDSRGEITTIVELHRIAETTNTVVRQAPAEQIPVVAGRRGCLHDHLMRLQTVLEEHFGYAVAIAFDDHAERLADA